MLLNVCCLRSGGVEASLSTSIKDTMLWAILSCKQTLTKGILLTVQLFFILEGEDKPLCPGLLTKPVLKLGWAFLGTHVAANSSPNFMP